MLSPDGAGVSQSDSNRPVSEMGDPAFALTDAPNARANLPENTDSISSYEQI